MLIECMDCAPDKKEERKKERKKKEKKREGRIRKIEGGKNESKERGE